MNLPVGGVALKVDHIGDWQIGRIDDGAAGNVLKVSEIIMRLAGLVSCLLCRWRQTKRRRGQCGWRGRQGRRHRSTPRPAFRKKSVQVRVLQYQTCHRPDTFEPSYNLSIILSATTPNIPQFNSHSFFLSTYFFYLFSTAKLLTNCLFLFCWKIGK